MLNTLEELVRLVKSGLSKAESTITIDKQTYNVSCYKMNGVIRIDLKPKGD